MGRLILINVSISQLAKIPRQEAIVSAQPKEEVYRSLPKYFESIQQWPTTSNLHCWECGQIPTSYPRFIPTSKYKTDLGTILYCVRGVFHDWCCAAAHVLIRYEHEAAEYLEMMCEVEAMFSGRRRVNMVASVSKFILRHYAGDANGVTFEQWNEQNTRKTATETIYADAF